MITTTDLRDEVAALLYDQVLWTGDENNIDDTLDAVIALVCERDAGEVERLHYELARQQAMNERILAILMGIYNLTAPADVTVEDKTYAFRPQDPTIYLAAWREMSNRIRSIQIDVDAAIAQQARVD